MKVDGFSNVRAKACSDHALFSSYSHPIKVIKISKLSKEMKKTHDKKKSECAIPHCSSVIIKIGHVFMDERITRYATLQFIRLIRNADFGFKIFTVVNRYRSMCRNKTPIYDENYAGYLERDLKRRPNFYESRRTIP